MLWIKQKGMTQWELGEGVGQTGTLSKDYQLALCENEMFITDLEELKKLTNLISCRNLFPGRGNSNIKVLKCLLCLMKSKEIRMTKIEGVKGRLLGDEIREKLKVESLR